jgi:site-specific recombinase XerD
METESKNLRVIIKKCERLLRESGYSEACIAVHLRKWQQGIQQYMDENSICEYSEGIGTQYLRISAKNKAPSTIRANTRNIHILTDFLLSGTIRKRIVHLIDYPLPQEIGRLAEKFLEKLKVARRCDLTINEHRRILSYFIEGLSLKSINRVAEINESDILDFINSAQHCKDKHLNTARLFCRFLYEEKYIDKNIEYIFGRNNFPKREKLPSVYDSMEIRKIEESVDQASAVGKRDYAILLLTTRLGLRASDVCNLEFSNLDWDKNIIHLTQYKTKRDLELPLLTDIGEAIINYLRYGRPVSNSSLIFLSAAAPYRTLNHISMNGIVSRIIKASGVEINNRKFGPHAMRHTLASQLLNNGISLPVISETLGHEKTQTTMNYLRIDLKSLMKCTLDVPYVNQKFYDQKGGIFYERI